MAAVLTCGDEAVASHRDAGAVWGLVRSAGTRIHVTVPGRSRAGQPGIVVHRVRSLHPDDRAVRNGIPVTSVARTLLDFAETAREDQVRRAFEEAERQRLLDMRAVDALLERSSGRRGQRVLRAVMAESVPMEFTRTDLERAFLELCRQAGLPRPAMNVWVAGCEVDAVWPEHGLAVEVDSYEFHRTRAAFERDRKRDTALQLAGYRVLRVTDRRLVHETADVVHSIGALL
jgi:very-short-patch-repair endonuclease